MQIIRGVEQGSPEWHDLRRGSVGGSSVNAVLAKGQGKSRKTLLYKLAGEILTGQIADEYQSPHYQRGHDVEKKARLYYEITTGREVEQVTLIKSDINGWHHSPDGIMKAEKRGLEIKSRLPHIYIELLETEKIPLADMRQCQNFLAITEWEEIDYCVYCYPDMPSRPAWIKTIYRDEKMIREIKVEVRLFLEELNAKAERLR